LDPSIVVASVRYPSAVDFPRKIIAFHQDEHGDWVADLECGHTQHVRHNPPWMNRPWVVTTEGRNAYLGRELNCAVCKESNQLLESPHES
jgi:hypothetical protein